MLNGEVTKRMNYHTVYNMDLDQSAQSNIAKLSTDL